MGTPFEQAIRTACFEAEDDELMSQQIKLAKELVLLYLSSGADPNLQSASSALWEKTPLIYAIWEENLWLAKSLLSSGADPILKTLDGETPLMFAAELDGSVSIEFVKLLKRHGAKLTTKDERGETAYDKAEGTGNTELLPHL